MYSITMTIDAGATGTLAIDQIKKLRQVVADLTQQFIDDIDSGSR